MNGPDKGVYGSSDDSPSLKGRGFYGFAPRLCRPTASRLASFNTREVACAAPASRTSTTSKTRSCCYPRERLTVERPNTMQLARCYQAVSHISSDARLRARRHSSPALKGRGLLPLKGNSRCWAGKSERTRSIAHLLAQQRVAGFPPSASATAVGVLGYSR